MKLALLLVGLAACGRYGFESAGDGGPGAGDADAPPAMPHLFVFDAVGDDEVNDVAFDRDGQMALAGIYTSTVTLGSMMATNIAPSGTDAYVAVFDRDGAPRWLWTAGTTVQGDAENLAWHGDGQLEVAGYFAGTVTRGTSLDAGAGQDTFGITFDPLGAIGSSHHFGGGRNVQPRGLDVSAHSVVSGGIYAETVDFGPGPLPNTGVNDNAWLVRFDTATASSTARAFNASDDVYINDVALGPNDEICITGRFKATTDFGSGPIAPAGQSTFVAIYDGGLSLRWVRTFGGSVVGNGVAFTDNGDCVVDGEFGATFTIDGFTAANAGASDGWLARFGAAAGEVQWLHRFGGPSADIAFAVTVAPPDEVIVAGNFQGTAMLDDLSATAEGAGDGYLIGYDGAGTRRWATLIGGAGMFLPGRGGMSFDRAHRRVAVAAQFSGALTLGSLATTATDLAGIVIVTPVPP